MHRAIIAADWTSAQSLRVAILKIAMSLIDLGFGSPEYTYAIATTRIPSTENVSHSWNPRVRIVHQFAEVNVRGMWRYGSRHENGNDLGS